MTTANPVVFVPVGCWPSSFLPDPTAGGPFIEAILLSPPSIWRRAPSSVSAERMKMSMSLVSRLHEKAASGNEESIISSGDCQCARRRRVERRTDLDGGLDLVTREDLQKAC